MSKLSSDTSRATMLGFQPPAIGDEEIAAVSRDAALRLADDRAARGRARAADGRVPRGRARARPRLRHRRAPSRARRTRRRAGRRGDHDADHLAGDGERDRAQRRDAGLRRRARRTTSTSTRALVAEAVTERTKAIMPVDLAGQPADLDPLLELGIPSSRTRLTPPRAGTAGARSARSPTSHASRSTRRRTSRPARVG